MRNDPSTRVRACCNAKPETDRLGGAGGALELLRSQAIIHRHLRAAPRRLAAVLREARRVLRDDGIVLSSYISRLVELMDGCAQGCIEDAAFERMALGGVQRGVHDSPDEERHFTLACVRRPEEVEPEASLLGASSHVMTSAVKD